MGLVISKGLTLRKEFQWNETVWNPSMITTALWLDAADASTITTVSSAVSQWNDKSGNGRNATQGTSGLRPTYNATGTNGLPRIEFNNRELTLPAGVYNSSPAACFVMNRGTTEAVPFRLQNTSEVFFLYNFTENRAWATRRGQAQVPYTQPALGPVSDIYVHDSGSSSGVTWSHVINGTAVSTAANIGNAGAGSNTNAIGRNSGGSNPLIGSINEIIVLPGAIASIVRQKLEGYLAHKWGLTASLPSDHPYKTVGPTP
jgi:hypothetical protein